MQLISTPGKTLVHTCAAGNWSESSYGSSGIHCLCSKHQRIWEIKKECVIIIDFTRNRLYSNHIKITDPFKGNNPATTNYAQKNVESPPVTTRHDMSCAVRNLVNNCKPTQGCHNLDHNILFPIKKEVRKINQTTVS